MNLCDGCNSTCVSYIFGGPIFCFRIYEKAVVDIDKLKKYVVELIDKINNLENEIKNLNSDITEILDH